MGDNAFSFSIRSASPDTKLSQTPGTVKENISKTVEQDLNRNGVEIVEDAATKFSLTTWNETDKRKVLSSLIKAGFTKGESQTWIDHVNGIAAIIAADQMRLDYDAADNQVMLKNNQEYVKTKDASTLCAKRLLYQGTFNRITELLPNTVLMPDDLIHIRKVMADLGDTVPCGICYVESRRKTLSKFAGQWLNEVYKGKVKVDMNDLTSTDGLERLRKQHPGVYDDYTKWMRMRGTANPKIVELRTAYRNDISKLTKSQIDKITRIGGLRVQSFSDFETVHLIDMMQAILDMSAKKLTSQAYTKVPNFAWAFGDTGIKINLSLIGKAENGKLVFDPKEGMPIEDAMKLRDRYSDNVGTILVGANDESILLAMADDRIDFIIPFHRSGWSKDQFEALGLSGYDDYQNYQNERNLDGSSIKEGNLYPIDYWDYSKTGKENAERYLEICKEQKRIPKFEKFLVDNGDGSWSLQPDGSTDGYWKMLIDFKMYNNEGIGAPQRAVTPTFNMEECERILHEYDGKGNRSLPVDEKAAQKFVKEYKTEHKGARFSRAYSNFDSLYDTLSDGRIKPKNVADLSTEDWKLIYKAVNKLGYGLESVQQAKDVYSRYVSDNGFNKEQSDAIKKAYGVTSDNGVAANPQREALARKTFGTTGDFREAGYLMRNGSMLDFSGKKDGGPAHVRYMDHREIGSVFSNGEIPAEKTSYGDQTAYMNAFISEGNIRLMESQGVTIGEMEPTSQQYTILKQFIDHVLKDEDYFYLDLSNNDGYTVASREYTSSDGSAKIIRDIKEYFKNGELPYRSSLAQFRYSRVADPEEIKRLNNEETVTVYRAMQVIDGELYPPMAAKVKDETGTNRLVEPTELGAWYRADERPDLIKDGKFKLDKANGTSLYAAYNPYWHTSRSMLNDQFSSAYKRPNLVTVECEVPASELTSGYKAEFAKDAVGEMQWHSGPVSSKLAKEGNPRRVILSRWVKVNRIVPDSEAAASIANMLKGTDITIPENTVTPSLKEELIKQGITVGDERQTRFSKALSFAEQVDESLAGRWNRYESLYVCDTPEILQAVGLKDYPMLMSQSHLRTITAPNNRTHQHGIDIAIVKQLPELLKKPLVIMESKSRAGDVVVVTNKADQNNNPIIVTIRQDGTGMISDIEVDSNYITSMYGKDRFQNFITSAINDNRILFADKKRIQNLTGVLGVQFAQGLINDGFYEQNIAQFTQRSQALFTEEDFNTRMSRSSDLDQMQLFTDDLKAQYAALPAEVEKQTERAEYFKGETRLRLEKEGADRYQVSDKGLNKIEQMLKKNYSSDAEIKDDLRTLINDFLNGRTDYDGAFNMALYVGNHLVAGSKELVSPDDQVYQRLKDYLKKTRIFVNQSARSDIPDYEAFRRRNLSRIRLTSDGTPVDVVYQELQSMFGKSYFPEVLDAQADQLMQIDDVLRTLTPVFENPYTSTSDAEMAVEAVAMDIMQTLMASDEIDKVAPTFADRQKLRREKEVARAKAQTKDYYEGRLNALRNSKDRRIQELKDSAERLRERRKDSAMRTKLWNIARRLQNRKLPAEQRQRLDEIIGDLDTVAKGITGRSIQNLTALKEWYEGKLDKNSPTYDPDFLRDEVTEKRIKRLEQRHIADMTQEEVLELTEVLLNIEHEIAYGKKLIDDAERRTTYQLAEATISNIYGTTGTKAGLVEFVDQTLVFGGLSGERAIRRMTGYVDSDPLYQATLKLSEGQRNMLDFQRRASALVQRFTEDKAFVDSITGKKARRITIYGTENGQRVSADITPAELISLYLHSKNDSNLYHIEYGGITVPDFDLLAKGKIYEAYEKTKTIKLRPSEVRAITAQMTDKERAFANAISEYFNGMSQKEINEVSEKLKGYSLAQVENYFPIETNKDFLKKDIATIENDGTIEGMGFLKERIQKASTPIMLREAQKVMNQSVTQTSKYVGLAIPVRNINKLLDVDLVNWTDGEADLHQGTIRKAIGDKWHDSGQDYLEQLMKDLQNRHTEKEKAINRLFNKITSNYAGAVLDMNLGVAIKQAASYPTAMAVLGYKPLLLAMGQFGKVDLRLIEKYTPLQWYRSQGYSTTELGDMASGVSKDVPTWLKWIQGMDLITTRKLWKASEIYVQQNPASAGLMPGSDEYYKEVARIYNRVIEETQPNYTVMQRPEALRSNDAIVRALNMFKTQPYQNFGLLYDAVQNFKAKQTQYQTMRSSEAEFALKEARKHLADAIVSQLISALVFAGMQFLWDVLRHKTDKYEDDKGKANAGAIAKGLGMNALSSGFGMIPYGSVALETVESATDKVVKALGGDAVFNQSFYGMDVPVLETLNNLLDGSGTAMADIAEVIRDVADGGEIGFENVRKIYKHTSEIFQTAGVPVKNTVNLLNAIMQNTAWTYQSIGGNYYMGNYASLRIQGASNTQMYQNLYQAYKNNRSAYQELYNQMIEDGYSENAIKNFFKKME
ncbi:MAG: hypothetical protein IKR22_06860 [Clostridiales bacterium]|nr:hypothetical protein [Clostridiales bacterium]